MSHKIRPAFLLFILIIGTACMFSTAQSDVHHINVSNFFFSPLKTHVQPGDTVRWHLVFGTHTTTSDNTSPKSWDSGIIPVSDSFNVVFELADGLGPFPYHCTFHPFSMEDTIYMDIPGDPTVFGFTVTEAEANGCAGTGSSAIGYGTATLSGDSSEISFEITHTVAGSVDAHIHLGAECVSGGVLFGFASPTSPISETFSATATDVANLLAGNLYVNIHSNDFPAGEIRGQINADDKIFEFVVDEASANACAGTGSDAAGFGIATLSNDLTELSFEITHSVTGSVDAHIHLAPACTNGGVLFPFASHSSPIVESFALSTTNLSHLLMGHLYANIHSNAFPAGEIRGQVEKGIFICGDANGDGSANVGDAVFLINFVFKGGPSPNPEKIGDANCDGGVNVGDAVYLINFVFKGGPAPCETCPE